MKITFINRGMGMFRGGGEIYALNLASRLAELGCEIRFITSKPWFGPVKYPVKDFETEYVTSPYLRDLAQRVSTGHPYFENIPIKPLRDFSQKGFGLIGGGIFRFDDLKSQLDIFDHLKNGDKDYDIVQVFSHSVLAGQIAAELKIPVVIRFPGPPPVRHKKYILKCNAVVASGASVQEIRNNITPNVIDIPNGVDTHRFMCVENQIRQKYGIANDDVLLLFVGRFVPLKNLPFLMQGMAKATKFHDTIRLLMVGEGPLYRRILDLSSELDLEKNVIFAGKVKHDELAEYYSAADALVLTSHYESFSCVALEAMACELPVIATKVGYLPTLIREGINGFLIQNNDAEDFKEAISKLVNNRRLGKEIGKRNREMVKVKYDWSKSAIQFLAIYERILKKFPKASF